MITINNNYGDDDEMNDVVVVVVDRFNLSSISFINSSSSCCFLTIRRHSRGK